MRNNNRRWSTSDGDGAGIVIFVLAVLAILSFQSVRVLLKPNTRDYRPAAYDIPHSRPLSADYVRALGANRLLSALAFLLVVMIGAALFPSILAGTLQSQQVIALVAVTLLTLVATLMTLLTARKTVPIAFASLIAFTLVAIFNAFVPQGQTSLVPTFLSCGLVTAGIALLQLGTLEGRVREAYDAWNDLSLWLLVLVALGVVWAVPFVFVLLGALLVLMLLGAALTSEAASDLDRFLVLLSALLAVVGAVADWLRLDTPIGLGAFSLSVAPLVIATLLRRKRFRRAPLVAASLITDPSLVVAAELTLTVLPAKAKYAPQTANALIGELLKLSDHLSLSVFANGGQGITWEVSAPGGTPLLTQIAGDIRSHSPNTEVFPTETPVIPSVATWRQLLLFGTINDYAAPLPFAEHLTNHDPLAVLCQRMSDLHDGEHIRYQVTITTTTAEAKTRAFRRLQQGKIQPLAALWKDANNPLAGFDEKLVTAKLEYPLYHCFISVTVDSPDPKRLEILSQAARDIEQFYLPGHNKLILITHTRAYQAVTPELAAQPDVLRLLEAWKREHSTPWRDLLCVLSAPEIAALWHLPSEDYQADAIAWARGRVPDAVFDPTAAVPLGETTAPGRRGKTVYLKATDRAAHHYIAGMTGTGKSTLMLRLIQADIAAGHGLAVIDPQGKLIADVIRTSIPQERLEDVVLLECRRTDFPVPINPFRMPAGMTIGQASTLVMFALQKIYESIWLLGQTELYIQNMVQLLLTDKEATPLDIQRMFQDKEFRQQLVAQLASRSANQDVATYSLGEFWKLYEKKSSGEKDKILSPIINRTGVLTHSAVMELMTCHPYPLDFKQMIDARKIVLIDLSGDNIYQDVDNLATLFLSGFFLGAYSLDGIADGAPPRFYLYVDEIERTATAPLAQILRESRKFGLAAILANQILGDTKEAVLNSILGNVGINTVFQLGIKDARFLAPRFEPELTDADLANLDLYQVAVKMRLKDKNLPAVVLKTEVPKPISGGIQIEALRAKAERELLSAENVRTWLEARYGDRIGAQIEPPEPTIPPKNGTWIGKVVDTEPDE